MLSSQISSSIYVAVPFLLQKIVLFLQKNGIEDEMEEVSMTEIGNFFSSVYSTL